MTTTDTLIKLTRQQHDNVLDALQNMWPSVPPENVIPGLYKYRKGESVGPLHCGTIACFGGFCAWWPPFMEQGVYAGHGGAPYINRDGANTSEALFGTYGMFSSRGQHIADFGFTGTDHELVTNRLQWLLKNSEVVE